MTSTISIIEQRVSANAFDVSHRMTDADIEQLVGLATRAPTAYNLQNWRFIAVRTPEQKARLRGIAYNQAKITDAAITFIICGILPDHNVLPNRLLPFHEAGFMSAPMISGWQEGARLQYEDPQMARNEAIRSASFGAATLMLAAEALGFASGPMVGFDAKALVQAFGLAADEIPALLISVGRAAPGNWPQKPRRPLAEVLEIL